MSANSPSFNISSTRNQFLEQSFQALKAGSPIKFTVIPAPPEPPPLLCAAELQLGEIVFLAVTGSPRIKTAAGMVSTDGELSGRNDTAKMYQRYRAGTKVVVEFTI